jgi:uncharacterized protein YgiM (DUF1202 family)
MSYLTCTNCLQRSPETATRCQKCGRAFGRPPDRPGESASRRSSTHAMALLAGAVLIVLAAYQWWPKARTAPTEAAPEPTTLAVSPPRAAPAPKETKAVPAESARAIPHSTPRPPVESHPVVAADTAGPVADTARPVAPRPTPEPVTIDPARQRYAQVWANLRAERSSTASILEVLHPGQVVAVDSLQQGWYRVITDQQAVGYVDQQYLDTLPPAAP